MVKKKKKIEPPPLTVTPLFGELFRFLVASRSTPGREYLVDISDNGGAGYCGCMHFEIRCLPHLSRGAAPCNSLRCSHIKRARDYFLDEIMPKLAKAFDGKSIGRKIAYGKPASSDK